MTLVDLLQYQARQRGDQIAHTFLIDGETEAVQLTYAALDEAARRIGGWLQSVSDVGERALLLYQSGLDYIAAFWGCLYAGVVAVPAYPPRPNRTLARLDTIVTDARASVVLTDSVLFSRLENRLDQFRVLTTLKWGLTDITSKQLSADSQQKRDHVLALQASSGDLSGRVFSLWDTKEDWASRWQPPEITLDSLALLQYTSGSTAKPKGVMVTHRNLKHNLAALQRAFQVTEADRGVFWVPLYHDMGLIGGVLLTIYCGCWSILLPPLAFLQKPIRWLAAISRYQATISGAPNFAYDLCAHQTTAAQRAELDLSHWAVAVVAAEPIQPETLDHFAETFAPQGFRNNIFCPAYGLAEGTLIVSVADQLRVPALRSVSVQSLAEIQGVNPVESRRLVSCGQPLPDQTLMIVDPKSQQEMPLGGIGEIWVAGPSVTQGYWLQPAQTETTFQAMISNTGVGPFLRTGDLGFLHQGELFITGRLKSLLIIRGQNYYPEDIERTIDGIIHPSLQPGAGAAFSIEVANEERLVIVQEVKRTARRTVNIEEVAAVVREAISVAHGLQLYALMLIRPGSLPRTSSGKRQRYRCREQYLQGTLKVIGQSVYRQGLAPESMLDARGYRFIAGSAVDWQQQAPTNNQLIKRPTDQPLISSPDNVVPDGLEKNRLADRQAKITAYLKQTLVQALQVPETKISLDQDLMALGLDSIMILELSHVIHQDLKLHVQLRDIFEQSTLDQLAEYLAENFEQLRQKSTSPISDFIPGDGQEPRPRSLELAQRNAPATVAISATFMSEPMRDTLHFWVRKLGITAGIAFTPHPRTRQQLREPTRLLHQNQADLNVVLVRLKDWFEISQAERSFVSWGDDIAVPPERDEQVIVKFVEALKIAISQAPVAYLIVLCPAPSEERNYYNVFEQQLIAQLAGLKQVQVITSERLTTLYPMEDYYNAGADELDHIPYTPAFYAALSTMVMRVFHSLTRRPYKVIVVDGDEMLWRGFCSEDGPQGVQLDAVHQTLQQFMLDQHEAGMLLCFCSQNDEADIRAVFLENEAMLLQIDDFAAWCINGQPKSENLPALASRLNVELERFIFIDVDPDTCAEVQANCPQVLTLNLPADPIVIPTFLAHIWAFDRFYA